MGWVRFVLLLMGCASLVFHEAYVIALRMEEREGCTGVKCGGGTAACNGGGGKACV